MLRLLIAAIHWVFSSFLLVQHKFSPPFTIYLNPDIGPIRIRATADGVPGGPHHSVRQKGETLGVCVVVMQVLPHGFAHDSPLGFFFGLVNLYWSRKDCRKFRQNLES